MRIFLTVTIFMAFLLPAFSQDSLGTQKPRSSQSPRNSEKKLKVNLYTSYVFDDKFDYYQDSYTYYNGTIKGGFQWGLGIEYLLRELQGIEIFYLRQDTYAPTSYQGGFGFANFNDNFSLNMNYIMLGSNRYLKTNKVDFYFGVNAGMAILNLKNPSSGKESSTEKFAWGAKLGCDITLSEKVKLKLQGHMTSPVQSMGGGFFFGTGGGGAGLSFYSTVYQFALGGGLVLTP